MKFLVGWLMVLILGIAATANATTISYDVSNISGSRWEYSYAITNDTLSSKIDEFSIYFDYGLYANLGVNNPKADWDGLTVESSLILGYQQSGYYDALATVSGISPSTTEAGFRVEFDWLGTGTPGGQLFDIVDPNSFSVLDSGITTANIAPVPEPGTMLLTGLGLAGFYLFKRKKYNA